MVRQFVLAAGLMWAAAASAQTPVSDSAHQSKEVGITNCTTAIKQSNRETVTPTEGVKGSVASQGAATGGSTRSVGTADLTGGAGQGLSDYASVTALPPPSSATPGQNVPAGAIPGTVVIAGFSNVGGINLSPLLNMPGAGLDVGAMLQLIKAGMAVAIALQQNQQTLTSASPLIGTINTSHGGWDQNAAGRIAQTAAWNQVLQTAAATTELRNQRLLAQIRAAAAEARLMQGQ